MAQEAIIVHAQYLCEICTTKNSWKDLHIIEGKKLKHLLHPCETQCDLQHTPEVTFQMVYYSHVV